MQRELPMPVLVGPVRIVPLDGMARVWAPRHDAEIIAVLRRHGASYDPGNRLWWLPCRAIGPLVQELQSVVDPLFRDRPGHRS